jgi:hypothetical protein
VEKIVTIEQLTPQQQALIPVYQKKWQQIALSTEPIDRKKAAESVKFAYAALGYKAPQIVICDSPRAAFDRISIPVLPTDRNSPVWRQIRQEIGTDLGKNIADDMLIQLTNNPSEMFLFRLPKIEIQRLLNHQLVNYFNALLLSAFGGLERSIDSCSQTTEIYRLREFDWFAKHPYRDINKYFFESIGRGALNDFYISVLNGDRDPIKWRAFQLLVAHCGWIYLFQNTCIVCDRPRILSLDSQLRLHAEGGPAIKFADGYSIYSYHGVTLPEQYGKIHPNEWQTPWIVSESNAELKRVLIQGIGCDRITHE